MPPHESIFKSAIRAMFKSFFVMLGFLLAIVLVLMFIGLASTSEVEQLSTVKVLPNAEGKRESLGYSGPVILQLDIHGVIGLDDLKTEKIRTQLVESREGDLKSDRVKAIFLSINSPGGTVTDADGIYHLLKEYKEQYKVPILAHVEGLCASGALMVSAAADKIVSSDVGLVGSVGVIMPSFFNASEAINKLGIQALTLYAGKGKDELNPFRTWKPDEGANIQNVIDYYYTYFVNMVTKNRPQLSKEMLEKDYGASIFPAETALKYGYIDATGLERRDALKLLVKDAGLEGMDYHVVRLETKGWVSELLKSESALFTGTIKHQLDLGAQFHPDLMNKMLYLYLPGGVR